MFPASLRTERRADCYRNGACEDRRRCDKASPEIYKVLRTTTPTRAASFTTIQFRYHRSEVTTFRKIVTVATVPTKYIVARLKMSGHTRGNGFLANTKMRRTPDFPFRIQPLNRFLNTPNT